MRPMTAPAAFRSERRCGECCSLTTSTTPNLLLSSYITNESRIMIRRNIQERVRTIAQFLRLDHDPYLVISNGRMFWMQDAYTTSSYFPSAQPVQDLDLNYIRNSVKV